MSRVRQLTRNFDPKRYEPEILKFWDEAKIYERLREVRKGSRRFHFLDGPPYPSSDMPHPGTVWNKIIKDSVLRFKRGEGYDVLDKPGWDTHGLPIEVMTEKALGFTSKKDIENYGIDKFVMKCKELATKNLESMTKHFKEFAVSMDWEHPYRTFENEYIESAWWGVKRIWEGGRLYEGERPVHWCPRCETVLSDYEVSESYKDLMDPSIYVKFKVRGAEREYLLIWTTTPWTLPGNVAVMVHPNEKYVKVRVNGDLLILAKARLDAVMKEAGVEEYEIVDEFEGRELEGLKYEHPLEDLVPIQQKLRDVHRVVLSEEYVTMEEGSGCVHSAPGHGKEDFEVGRRYGLPVVSPVDERGRFTEDAGKYSGLQVREANGLIIEDLEERGALFHRGTVIHKYPVCWRCDTPLIIRTTKQWFVKLTDLREKLLEESGRAKWVPKWGGERRFRDWLLGLEDWIISRQRYWGIPLPIWRCESCGHIEVVGSAREIEERAGIKLEDLHRPWVDQVTWKCPKCGGEMRRIPDIMDVWYDSGVSFFASVGYPHRNKEIFQEIFPVDFITEGHDQIRGWFFSLLRMGTLLFNRVPYKSVLMHGFMLDEKGREMHKRLGNYVPPPEILKNVARDTFRFFVLTKVPWQDLRFSWKGLKEMERRLSVVWNVYVFATTYLRDRELGRLPSREELDPVNRWVLSRFHSMMKKVRDSMNEYHLHVASNEILSFLIDDLSHLYLRVARKKLRSKDRSVADQWGEVLFYVLRETLPYLSIFAPLMAEKIYLESFRGESDPESVNFLLLADPEEEMIEPELETMMDHIRSIVSASGFARSSAGIRRRQPLKEMVVVTENAAVRRAVEVFKDVLITEANVRDVRVGEAPVDGKWAKADFNEGSVFLNLEIGEEEILGGLARELTRRIQLMRKELGLTIGLERIEVYVQGDDDIRRALERYYDEIAWDSDANVIKFVNDENEVPGSSFGKEWEIDGRRVFLWVKKVE